MGIIEGFHFSFLSLAGHLCRSMQALRRTMTKEYRKRVKARFARRQRHRANKKVRGG